MESHRLLSSSGRWRPRCRCSARKRQPPSGSKPRRGFCREEVPSPLLSTRYPPLTAHNWSSIGGCRQKPLVRRWAAWDPGNPELGTWNAETADTGGMIIAKQSNFCCRENLNDHFDFLEHICNRFWGFWESRSQSTPNCKWRSRLKHQTWKNCFHRGFYWLLNFNGWLISISPLHQNQLWVVEVQNPRFFCGHGLEAPMNKFPFKLRLNRAFEGNSNFHKTLSSIANNCVQSCKVQQSDIQRFSSPCSTHWEAAQYLSTQYWG